MIYFGTSSGRLVGLQCPSRQTDSLLSRYSFQMTLEGQIRAQVRPLQRREWEVGLPSTSSPEDLATAQEFLAGAWGDGPFWFVSADAPSTNLLTPAQSTCAPEAGTGLQLGNYFDGPMKTPHGWAPRSIGNEDPSRLLYFGGEAIPVLPDMPVTAAAYVAGENARVRLYFYDDSLTQLSSTTSSITASDGTAVRSYVTAIPPDGAVFCRIFGVSAVQGSRPSITWGDTLYPWSDGQGCPKAVMHDASREVVRAVPGPNGQRLQALSFTVTEVG